MVSKETNCSLALHFFHNFHAKRSKLAALLPSLCLLLLFRIHPGKITGIATTRSRPRAAAIAKIVVIIAAVIVAMRVMTTRRLAMHAFGTKRRLRRRMGTYALWTPSKTDRRTTKDAKVCP